MEFNVNLPRISEVDEFPIGRIRVWPASENIRKYIYHPLGYIKFRETMAESVEWPFDQFTKRRLRDKTVFDHPPDTLELRADPPIEPAPEVNPGLLETDQIGAPLPPKK
jgi:hypothetical protein